MYLSFYIKLGPESRVIMPARWQPLLLLLFLGVWAGWWLGSSLDLSRPNQNEIEEFLGANLRSVLPNIPIRELTPEQRKAISEAVVKLLGINATDELDYQRLNYSYGWMGAEQHLPRYPGDRLSWKDELPQAGMTPGRGAFGYFADNKQDLTWEKYMEEKYYVAVQTLYLDTWNQEWLWLKDWYKFRKVLVINPENGRAVVAVIGDAGPARFTGKQFGGSPEVMNYLGLYKGKMKGLVLVLFVDSGGKHVPLGPVRIGGGY